MDLCERKAGVTGLISQKAARGAPRPPKASSLAGSRCPRRGCWAEPKPERAIGLCVERVQNQLRRDTWFLEKQSPACGDMAPSEKGTSRRKSGASGRPVWESRLAS